MKMTIPNEYGGPPFSPEKLITTGKFIAFCERHGVRISQGELEFFEQQGLLYPAVRVYRPVERYLKVIKDGVAAFVADETTTDGQFYFSQGSILDHRKDWLKDYHSEIPAEVNFRPWSGYATSETQFVESLEQVRAEGENFYLPEQIFGVRRIQYFLKISLGAHHAAMADGEWVSWLSSTRKQVTESVDSLKDWMRSLNRFLGFYQDFEVAAKLRNDATLNWYTGNELRQELGTKDVRAKVAAWERAEMAAIVKRSMRKHGLTQASMRAWMDFFIAEVGSVDPGGRVTQFLSKMLPVPMWQDVRLGILYSKLSWDFGDRVCHAHGLISKSKQTMAGLFEARVYKFPHRCEVCGGEFHPTPTRKGGTRQVTCSPYCSRMRKQKITKKNRIKNRKR